MRIDGRHVGALRAVHPKFVGRIVGRTLRIDDENNLDFWLAIDLTADDIRELRENGGQVINRVPDSWKLKKEPGEE